MSGLKQRLAELRDSERPERTVFALPMEAGALDLRQATIDDLAAVLDLRSTWPGYAESNRAVRDEVTSAFRSGGLLVATDDFGRVVADACVRIVGMPGSARGADANVSWTVAPDRRREGIGRAVCLAVMARLVEAGCEDVLTFSPKDDRAAFDHLAAIGLEVDEMPETYPTLCVTSAERVVELTLAPPSPRT